MKTLFKSLPNSYKEYLSFFNTLLIQFLDRTNLILSKVAKLPTWSDGISVSNEGKTWIKETTSKVTKTRGSKTTFKNPKFVGEFRKYVDVTCWMIGNKAIRADLNLFLRRVEKIILSSSSTWAFAYLKECYRLTVRALAGSPEVTIPYGQNTLLVRRDANGLPRILPPRLRTILMEFINYMRLSGNSIAKQEIEDSIVRLYPEVAPGLNPGLRKDIVGILTVMTIFRTFKTKVTPTVSTIIQPFGGSCKTLSKSTIMMGLRRLGLFTGIGERVPSLSIGKFKPHRSTKAGPNGSISILGASLDALALLHEPKVLGGLLEWMSIQGAYFYMLLLIANIVLFGPFYLLFAIVFPWLLALLANNRLNKVISMLYNQFWLSNGEVHIDLDKWIYYKIHKFFSFWRIAVGKFRGERDKLYCGKLSVVYDQAGKARIVASVNWWIQSAFYGLHSSIFKFLKTVPSDGTFDQKLAFDRFLENISLNHKMSGFDLSAATDRLPIELQRDILNAAGLPGNLWQSILSFPYCAPFENKEDTSEVSYEVGQPMGAYSSWAMLALTHHVIVHVAALNASLPLTDRVNYAVLGDDMIVNHNSVAAEYLEIMAQLGVSISLGKSVISYSFTEFAKTLRGPGFDISPIGAGAVLGALRSALMFPSLFLASFGNV